MSPRTTIFTALAAAIIGAIAATAFTPPRPPAPEAPATFPLIESIGSIASGETSPPTNIAKLLTQHAKGKAPDDRYARALLAASLVASDPSAAVVLARKKSDLEKTIINAFTIPDSHKDTARSLIRTKAIPAPEAAHLLAQLADGTDTAALLALQVNDSDATSSSLRSELNETVKTDPQKAIADAIAQVPISKLESTLEDLFESWAKSDPYAAWNAIALTPLTIDQGDLQTEVIDEWFKKDPSKAAAFLTENTATIDRNSLDNVAEGLIALDPKKALAWAEDAVTPHSRDLFRAVASQLGNSAPDTFLDALEAGFLSNSPDPAGNIESFASSYARNHEDEALAWASTFQGDYRTNVISEIVGRNSTKNPEASFDLIENSQLTSKDLASMTSDIDDLALHDLPRYLALFESATEEVANKAISKAAYVLTLDDRYSEARELYAQTGFQNSDIENQAQDTVTEWTQNDPTGAVGWVEEIPSGSSRNYATQNLVDQWVRHDREGALTYAQSLPEGSHERQFAALALAERLAAGAPDDAIAWAREIANDDQLSKNFLNSKEIDSLIYHAPDQLLQIFPQNEALTQKIEADQAWRSYLRNYQPLPSDSRL